MAYTHRSDNSSNVTNSLAGRKGSLGSGTCGGDWSAMPMAISSPAASIETRPCRWPSPPCRCDTAVVTADDTRGCCCCCCCCTGEAGSSVGEESGDALVTGDVGEARGGDAGEDSRDTPVTDARCPLLLRNGWPGEKWARARTPVIQQSMAATAGTTSQTFAALPVAGMSHWAAPSRPTTVARRWRLLPFP